MPVAFDTSGMEQYDERTWFCPRTGDQVSLTYIDLVPDLPAPLDNLPLLRHRLALETAEVGALIQAHVVTIDSVPTLLQVLKLPIPDRESGQAFIAAFTVPKATCSVVLRIQCAEGDTTGLRESAVIAQVGPEAFVRPHPYAPALEGRLPWHVGDEERWDGKFPDHPLARAREWAHRTIGSARIDPAFAELPPFKPSGPGPNEHTDVHAPVERPALPPAASAREEPEPEVNGAHARPDSESIDVPALEAPALSDGPARVGGRPERDPASDAPPPARRSKLDSASAWQLPPPDPEPSPASSGARSGSPFLPAAEPAAETIGARASRTRSASPPRPATPEDATHRISQRDDGPTRSEAARPALGPAGGSRVVSGAAGAQSPQGPHGFPGGAPDSGAFPGTAPDSGGGRRIPNSAHPGASRPDAPQRPMSAGASLDSTGHDPFPRSTPDSPGAFPGPTAERLNGRPGAGPGSAGAGPFPGASPEPSNPGRGGFPGNGRGPGAFRSPEPTHGRPRTPDASGAFPGTSPDSGGARPGASPDSRGGRPGARPSPGAFPGTSPDSGGARPGAFPGTSPDSGGARPGAFPGTSPDSPGARPGATPDPRGATPDAGGAYPRAFPGTSPEPTNARPGAFPGTSSDSGGARPGGFPGTSPDTTNAYPRAFPGAGPESPGATPGTSPAPGNGRPGAFPGIPHDTAADITAAHSVPGGSPDITDAYPTSAFPSAALDPPGARPGGPTNGHPRDPANGYPSAYPGSAPDSPGVRPGASGNGHPGAGPASPAASSGPGNGRPGAFPGTPPDSISGNPPGAFPGASPESTSARPPFPGAAPNPGPGASAGGLPPALRAAFPGSPPNAAGPRSTPQPPPADPNRSPVNGAGPANGHSNGAYPTDARPGHPPNATGARNAPNATGTRNPAIDPSDAYPPNATGTRIPAAAPGEAYPGSIVPRPGDALPAIGPATGAASNGFPGAPHNGLAGAARADAFPGFSPASRIVAPGAHPADPSQGGQFPGTGLDVTRPASANPTLPAGGRPMASPGGFPPAPAEPIGLPRAVGLPPAAPMGTAGPRPGEPPGVAGELMHTVLIGLPIGGYLPLWHNDSVSYWRMADPTGIRGRIGIGLESRTEIDNRRFREAALFAPDRNTLFLMDRYRNKSGNLGGASTQLIPASETEAYRAADDKAMSDFYSWIGDIVVAAGQRGEYVAIETGGWHVPVTPVVLIMLRTDGRDWHSVVETSPVPLGAPVWRDQQPVDGDTQLLASPATDRTIRAAGLLTRFAVATWPMHPFQLGLSFGPNPTLGDGTTR